MYYIVTHANGTEEFTSKRIKMLFPLAWNEIFTLHMGRQVNDVTFKIYRNSAATGEQVVDEVTLQTYTKLNILKNQQQRKMYPLFPKY